MRRRSRKIDDTIETMRDLSHQWHQAVQRILDPAVFRDLHREG